MFSEISRKKLKNGGFSLIELIIVVAILVALVAVLAPSYMKYVKKARDVVVTQAAEDVLTLVKAEYGAYVYGEGDIKVCANEEHHINVSFENYNYNGVRIDCSLTYIDEDGNTGIEAFRKACGIEPEKSCQSDMVYLIHISNGGNISAHPELKIEEETTYVE